MTSNNLDQLAMDAINEYLELAEYAINTSRQEGSDSCYGNAALLLLSSVLDSIGSYYNHKDNPGLFVSFGSKPNLKEREGAKDHFKQVYNIFISNMNDNCGYTSADMFTNDFYENFRCGVTHNAVFLDSKLTMHDKNNNSDRTLNINDLFNMVKRVKDEFFNTNKSTFTFTDNPIEPNTAYTPTNNVSQN